MPDKYYNKATGSELFINPLVPAHLRYIAANPDHEALPDTNPFFSAVPEGMRLEYDGSNIPTVLVPIPDYDLNVAKAAKISEITAEFDSRAQADGINVSLDEVRRDLQMRGLPPAPTSDQSDLYANVAIADAAIASVSGYVDISDVDNFDVSVPSGTGYAGGVWS